VHWIVALLLVPVLAWGMWLYFCYKITDRHGIEALKAAPPIAKAFPVTEWIAGLRAVGPWVLELLGRGQPPAVTPPQNPAVEQAPPP
jgi:hypothetical protein